MSKPGANFNEAAFKRDWRTLCALGNIDPIEGVQHQSVYAVCNLRAEWQKWANESRTFEHRCDHPDDGRIDRATTIRRPTEGAAPWPKTKRQVSDVLDTLTIDILRELYAELKEEDEREPESLAAMDRRLGRAALWQKEYRRGHLTDVRVTA